jgi:hypothetical protein
MKTNHQHSTFLRVAGLFTGVASALLCTQASAQLLSHDPFAGYTIGGRLPYSTPSPGVAGYTGDWADAGFGDAEAAGVAGSLSYSNPLYVGSSGDRVGKGADTAGINAGNSGRTFRLLDGTLAATDATAGTVYLSWLYQNGNENAAAQADIYQTLALYNGDAGNDGNRTFDAGISAADFASGDYAFRVNNNASLRSTFGVARDANVHLFVAKIDLSASPLSDSVTMWLDPILGAGDPLGGITFSGFDLRYDRLALSDYASNSSHWDEVRWGGTFDSVTVPEPGAGALLGVASGLLATLRRKQVRR